MKQGRLSFSTKRKDPDSQDEDCKDLITIRSSPEKPPPKKICRDQTEPSTPDDGKAKNKSPEGKSSKETIFVKSPSVSNSPPGKVCQELKGPSPSPDDRNVEDFHAKSLTVTIPIESLKNDNDGKLEDDLNVTESDESSMTQTEKSELIAVESESNSDADDEMNVSTAESSVMNSTLESTPDESEAQENPETTPKRPRLSKTEATYLRLKQKKDRELRQKQKEDRLKLKQEERERREQEKKEVKERRDKERLEKERKKEEERQLREKERLEKEKKKEEERLEREKEKEEKEKLRKEKEDEKRRREEDKKRELEEEIAKKEKAKQAFRSFFVKKSLATQGSTKSPKALSEDGVEDVGSRRECTSQTKFRPFQLKKGMKLAQIVPENAKTRFEKNTFEAAVKSQDTDKAGLYLRQLKQGYKPSRCNNKAAEAVDPEEVDVILISRGQGTDDESSGGRMRAKLLQFVENYRPAYYGTWRKKCPQVNGRTPFNKYSEFDYTIDSDDEWEEGEGESLVGTDDEKEDKDEVEEDYEEDDFLVPHGYLSESEEDEEDDQPMDPEALKARIAIRQEEFKAERKAGLQKKKIVAVCALGPSGVSLQEELKVLAQFKAVLLVANGLKPSWEREPDIVINSKDAEPAVLSGKALELFCRTAHGFQRGVRQMYDLFIQKWKAVSDVRVSLKSLKMTLTTCCKKSKSLNALVVNNHLVEKFGLEQLEVERSGDGNLSSKHLPNDVIPALIKVTQGNSKTSQIVEDFLTLIPNRKFGKAQVKRTLTLIGEFDHVQRCWLVKDECLKEHGLEELKIMKATKKDQVKEEKSSKVKDSNEPKEDKKLKEEKPTKDADDDLKNCNKENDDVEDVSLASGSPKADSTFSSNRENTTPRRVSIKSFFTPKSKQATPPPAAMASSTQSPTNSKSIDTPKAKKRVQLTTLSRTPTLKEENRSETVLEEEEVILIDDSN